MSGGVGRVPGTIISYTEMMMHEMLVERYPWAHAYGMKTMHVVHGHIEAWWHVVKLGEDGQPVRSIRVLIKCRDMAP